MAEGGKPILALELAIQGASTDAERISVLGELLPPALGLDQEEDDEEDEEEEQEGEEEEADETKGDDANEDEDEEQQDSADVLKDRPLRRLCSVIVNASIRYGPRSG